VPERATHGTTANTRTYCYDFSKPPWRSGIAPSARATLSSLPYCLIQEVKCREERAEDVTVQIFESVNAIGPRAAERTKCNFKYS
jgi:hypothetical protein